MNCPHCSPLSSNQPDFTPYSAHVPKFQAKAMDKICHRLHAVGKPFLVWDQCAVVGACRVPAVVDHHPLEAHVLEAVVDHRLRCRADLRVGAQVRAALADRAPRLPPEERLQAVPIVVRKTGARGGRQKDEAAKHLMIVAQRRKATRETTRWMATPEA